MMLGNGYRLQLEGPLRHQPARRACGTGASAPTSSPTPSRSRCCSASTSLNKYRGHYYAKAQNLARKLSAAYDAALAKYDLLLMPTLPMRGDQAARRPTPARGHHQRAFEMIGNTAPFDVTGHPAMSMPCGISDGLPVGLMLVGKHFDESTIYRAADAFEKSRDWKKVSA